MWAAVRYRPVQDAVLAVLSALITACAVFAPLYDRALQQAAAEVALARAPVQVTGLSLSSSDPGHPDLVVTYDRLLSMVPASLARSYRPPVPSVSVDLTATGATPSSSRVGTVLWRQHECAHLRIAGACPARRGEIVVSRADAAAYGWRAGSRIPVQERVDGSSGGRTPHKTMRVTGVYDVVRGDYWFGRALTGRSGATDPDTHQPQFDDWVTAEATMEGPAASLGKADEPGTSWVDERHEADWVLRRDRVGVDQLLSLGPAVQRFTVTTAASSQGPFNNAPDVGVYSGLPDITGDVQHGRDQAAVVVPLLLLQLGLLGVVVLVLVLAAATEQRRPEVALSRLRGRGRAGARSLLLRELGPVVLAGVPVGALLGLALYAVARAVWLPRGIPFEAGSGVLAALVVSTVVLGGVTVILVRRTARDPVPTLLRRVPTRVKGWAPSVAGAMLVAASLATFAAFVSGGLSGPAALVAPPLLALALGIVLAHAISPVAAAAGRHLLARGRVGQGSGLLQLARGFTTRRALAVVVVGTSLLVFASDAVVVGARNRAARADAEVGAAAVLTVGSSDVQAVRDAARSADPTGRSLTTVVQVAAPGVSHEVTEAVLPAEFARVAASAPTLGLPARWSALDAPATPPVPLRGSSLSLRIGSSPLEASGQLAAGARLEPVHLGLRMVDPTRSARVISVGDLAVGGTASHSVRVAVPCVAGCLLTGITVSIDPFQPDVAVRFTLSHLAIGAVPVPLRAQDWPPLVVPGQGRMAASTATAEAAASSGLEVNATADRGTDALTLRHGSVPASLPALTAGPLPADARGAGYQGLGLDGVQRSMVRVGMLGFAPAAPLGTSIVNLDVLQRDGAVPQGPVLLQIWSARDDPALLARVGAQLRDRRLSVVSRSTAAGLRHTYDESAAAWGLQLGVVVGVAALLVAAVVLLVLAAGSWRARARDLAALRMAGLASRQLRTAALTEQLPLVAVGVLVGSVCGVVGAFYALPGVPLFGTAPDIPVIDLGTAWAAVLAATVTAAVVLGSTGWLVAAQVARRSDLDRVREGA